MSLFRFTIPPAVRCLVLALVISVPGWAARNHATWGWIDLPAVGVAGQTIRFSASVTNAGDAPWDGSYYAEPGKLSQLRLADGRAMADVFTIRWVGAYMTENRRFVTGENYAVAGSDGPVAGKYINPKFWSYREHFPSGATALSGRGPGRGVEAVTVQPESNGRDRFGRAWRQNWPAGEGFHYETPARVVAIPLDDYGRIWRAALTVARNLEPKFLLTTWAEFGSENDEPRPELSATIMDNNKFGTHFGDALKEAVRRFRHTLRIVAEDGVGGTAAAGVNFLGEPPASALSFVVSEPSVAL